MFAQNIDHGYTLEPLHLGGPNEYPRPMFKKKKRRKKVYPCKPHFYYIKVGCKGFYLHGRVVMMIPVCVAEFKEGSQ